VTLKLAETSIVKSRPSVPYEANLLYVLVHLSLYRRFTVLVVASLIEIITYACVYRWWWKF